MIPHDGTEITTRETAARRQKNSEYTFLCILAYIQDPWRYALIRYYGRRRKHRKQRNLGSGDGHYRRYNSRRRILQRHSAKGTGHTKGGHQCERPGSGALIKRIVKGEMVWRMVENVATKGVIVRSPMKAHIAATIAVRRPIMTLARSHAIAVTDRVDRTITTLRKGLELN